MSGNSRTFCLDDPGALYPDWAEQYANWRFTRGGFWRTTGPGIRLASRMGESLTNVLPDLGLRPMVYPRLPFDGLGKGDGTGEASAL